MIPRTKREYLKHLVAAKNGAFRPLTDEERAPGFLGWHERGYLPHCDYPGLVQFVTFRLHDSMPASRRGEWEHLLAIEDARDKRTQLETYLDRGRGECHLRDARVTVLAERSLLHGHSTQYELLAWVVMPNHVHVLVQVWRRPLWKLVKEWKGACAVPANQLLQRRGPFWEREYWDTFMRDEMQERKAVRYIENNPTKARLCLDPAAWRFGSARHRDPRTLELKLPEAERRISIRRDPNTLD